VPFADPDRRRAYERERERRRARPSAKERGYGSAHKRLRARWVRVVEAGYAVCARCNRPIQPGTPWDLGHDDVNRNVYTGPEHRACNRATASVTRRRSRIW
jgi:hypothetical protein